jgi:hypothetical protein
MNKYIILIEEKPSIWEISYILSLLNIDLKPENIVIKPEKNSNNVIYNIDNITNIKIYLVQGTGSFIDYLVYKLDSFDNIRKNILELAEKPPMIAVESTKTRPGDSGNSGPYQRIGKFISLSKKYGFENYKNITKTIFYDNDLSKLNNSFIRGMKISLSIGINIVNKTNTLPKNKIPKYFKTIEDLQKEFNGKEYKNGDKFVKLRIVNSEKNIKIQAKLFKMGGLNYDPNIGFTTSISFFIRFFSDQKNKKIIFTNHFLEQKHIYNSNNKWIQNMNYIKNYDLENINLTNKKFKKVIKKYFKNITKTNEKIASILLDVLLRTDKFEKNRYWVIFSNHAGAEKTDVKSLDGNFSFTTKKISGYLYPDLVFVDTKSMTLYIVEGKIWQTRNKGLEELKKMNNNKISYKLRNNKEYKTNFINDTENFINKHSDKKIQKVVSCLCLMAPDIKYKKIEEFSKKSDYHVIFSINSDNEEKIEF